VRGLVRTRVSPGLSAGMTLESAPKRSALLMAWNPTFMTLCGGHKYTWAKKQMTSKYAALVGVITSSQRAPISRFESF
jgi:hypothetical protein